jgi:flagellar basal body-associated protein FliL
MSIFIIIVVIAIIAIYMRNKKDDSKGKSAGTTYVDIKPITNPVTPSMANPTADPAKEVTAPSMANPTPAKKPTTKRRKKKTV